MPGASLDITWLTAKTKQAIVEAFYTAAAEEEACHLPECNYTTKSRRKLTEHLVTYYIVYSADCGYLTLRYDSIVKHLNLCHNRYRSITQVDATIWPRLHMANLTLLAVFPPLPMSAQLYRPFNCCTMDLAAMNAVIERLQEDIIAVKGQLTRDWCISFMQCFIYYYNMQMDCQV